MTITNYEELQSATINWMDRSQGAFVDRITEFITLAEDTINLRLRVRQQLTSATFSMSSGMATLPTNFLEWKRVTRLASFSQSMQWVEPDYFSTGNANQVLYLPGQRVPSGYFTIEGEVLRVGPLDDSLNVETLYYAKVPSLSVTTSTNWLLTAHPGCYLAATLAEASVFAEDPSLGQLWMARRDQAFAEIERVSRATQGQAAMRATGPTP